MNAPTQIPHEDIGRGDIDHRNTRALAIALVEFRRSGDRTHMFAWWLALRSRGGRA